MAKGFSYFATDQHGNVYTRYSSNHAEPRYQWASIVRNAGGIERAPKDWVSYSSRRYLAEATMRRIAEVTQDWRGQPVPPREGEVVAVRAYHGRFKSEPKA